ADNAFTHRANLGADTGTAVVEAPAEIIAVESSARIRGHPRADVALCARLHGRERQRSCRCECQNLYCTSHCIYLRLFFVQAMYPEEVTDMSSRTDELGDRLRLRQSVQDGAAGTYRTSRPVRADRSAAGPPDPARCPKWKSSVRAPALRRRTCRSSRWAAPRPRSTAGRA